MTRKEKAAYEDVEVLRQSLEKLRNKKFRLDCGHHVTFGHFLGNDIIICNGKKLKIMGLSGSPNGLMVDLAPKGAEIFLKREWAKVKLVGAERKSQRFIYSKLDIKTCP